MSLVPPSQQASYVNGESGKNGMIVHAPTLGEGIDRLQTPVNTSQAFDFWGFSAKKEIPGRTVLPNWFGSRVF